MNKHLIKGFNEIGLIGENIRYKLLISFTLSSIIPVLLMVYININYEFPQFIDIKRYFSGYLTQIMIMFSLILIGSGYYIILNIIRGIEILSIISKPGNDRKAIPLDVERHDEIGLLVKNFSGMMELLEKNAHEVGEYAGKLEQVNKELVESKMTLEELSLRDELTGLFNRRYFNLRLGEEIRRSLRYSRKFSLIEIDIDNFKNYNDKYGHPEGDILLKEFSSLLSKQCRDVDLAYRIGGEEFYILMSETDKEGAYIFAERIRNLTESYNFGNPEIGERQSTISIGIATFPEDGTAPDEITAAVDSALYTAKKEGKNRSVKYSLFRWYTQ